MSEFGTPATYGEIATRASTPRDSDREFWSNVSRDLAALTDESFMYPGLKTELQRREVALLGGSCDGQKYRGFQSRRFAIWLYPLRINLGDPDPVYRLWSQDGFHAYIHDSLNLSHVMRGAS